MTKEFLNTELKPYNDLTREEKHILLDAVIDGNCEYYGMRSGTYNCSWHEKESEAFDTDMIYRTKPKEYKKLNIPWDVIDEKWKCAAMDATGKVFLYGDIPEFTHSCWGYEERSFGALTGAHILKLDTTGVVAEHSLTMRPEGV